MNMRSYSVNDLKNNYAHNIATCLNQLIHIHRTGRKGNMYIQYNICWLLIICILFTNDYLVYMYIQFPVHEEYTHSWHQSCGTLQYNYIPNKSKCWCWSVKAMHVWQTERVSYQAVCFSIHITGRYTLIPMNSILTGTPLSYFYSP